MTFRSKVKKRTSLLGRAMREKRLRGSEKGIPSRNRLKFKPSIRL